MTNDTATKLPDLDERFDWYGYWAQTCPDEWAIVTSERRVTYAELERRIERRKTQLRRQGISSGVQLVHDRDSSVLDWVPTLVAGLNLGAESIIPDEDWSAHERTKHVHSLLEHDSVPGVDKDGEGGLWLFTSGTTNTPKPRFRSRVSLRSELTRVRDRLPDDLRSRRPAGLSLLPLSHGFGLINSLFLIHAIGGTVLFEDVDNLEAITEVLRDYPVEILYTWPLHLQKLSVTELWQQAAVSLCWCVSSSMPLQNTLASRFSRITGCSVRQQYGATETGPLSLDAADSPHDNMDCMGRPLEGVDFRVLDPEGQTLSVKQEGELAVQVEHLSLPEEEMTNGGYWRTGDLGYRDSEGRVYVLGRYDSFTDERRTLMQQLADQ